MAVILSFVPLFSVLCCLLFVAHPLYSCSTRITRATLWFRTNLGGGGQGGGYWQLLMGLLGLRSWASSRMHINAAQRQSGTPPFDHT